MKLLPFILAGTALAAGVAYLVRKREDGTCFLHDFTNKAPEWMGRGKQYAPQTINQVTDQIRHFNRKS